MRPAATLEAIFYFDIDFCFGKRFRRTSVYRNPLYSFSILGLISLYCGLRILYLHGSLRMNTCQIEQHVW